MPVAHNEPAATGPSRRYLQWVRKFPLRPLKSAADAEAATQILDRFFGGVGADKGEEDYMHALALLLSAYEQDHEIEGASAPRGHLLLKHVVEESGMRQAELAGLLGVGASAASMILSGRRPITAEHARRLGARFKLSAGLFL